MYLDPWIVFGGRWNGLGWIMISVGLQRFGDIRSLIESARSGPGKSKNGPHGP